MHALLCLFKRSVVFSLVVDLDNEGCGVSFSNVVTVHALEPSEDAHIDSASSVLSLSVDRNLVLQCQ